MTFTFQQPWTPLSEVAAMVFLMDNTGLVVDDFPVPGTINNAFSLIFDHLPEMCLDYREYDGTKSLNELRLILKSALNRVEESIEREEHDHRAG